VRLSRPGLQHPLDGLWRGGPPAPAHLQRRERVGMENVANQGDSPLHCSLKSAERSQSVKAWLRSLRLGHKPTGNVQVDLPRILPGRSRQRPRHQDRAGGPIELDRKQFLGFVPAAGTWPPGLRVGVSSK